MKDLHILPKVRDSWSYLYIERARIDQDGKAIAVQTDAGTVPVPCANLNLLLFGPGTTVTHAAIKVLAEHGCIVEWVGEEGVRFYARGEGETRSASNLLRQAGAWADPARRLEVARRMYRARFPGVLDPSLTLQQLRGREGARVRDAYAAASRATGVPWVGRQYKRDEWAAADPVNRALSSANACLYGLVHAAVVAAGYSPALGFVHTGKTLSFVYDVADLYKATTTIPAAFDIVAEGGAEPERRIRHRLRDAFREAKLLKRIVVDIDTLFHDLPCPEIGDVDADDALPGGLWDPITGQVEGGVNFEEGP